MALKATAAWLRRAFSELRFTIEDVAVTGDRAVAWVSLRGVHTGPFVVHESPDGAVTGVFRPPAGASRPGRCTGSGSRTD